MSTANMKKRIVALGTVLAAVASPIVSPSVANASASPDFGPGVNFIIVLFYILQNPTEVAKVLQSYSSGTVNE